MTGAPLLETRGISKSFPGVRALSDVSFAVSPGEVHALLGENGAGKSTLLRILAGMESPDRGTILWEGEALRLRGPRHASDLGIAMIHQELMPFREMSVAENLFMGREPVRGWPARVDVARMREESRRILARLGARIEPGRRMGDLGVGEMQLVEIAKALVHRARLIIMDEPTSALSAREAEALFRIVEDLRRSGVAVVYVSHRLPEIFRLARVVSVLRDGCHVGTLPVPGLREERLIEMMVGREISGETPARERCGVEGVALRVRGLGLRGAYSDISFDVHPGEIVGLAGLMGAGRSALLRSLAGLATPERGEIRVFDRRVMARSPREALACGIAYASDDRKALGLVPRMGVRGNLTLGLLERYRVGPWIDRARERRVADEWIDALSIRVAHRDVEVRTLSGGNQQKVVLARALLREPRVLLLDEPTRGVDVGAKAELHAIVRRVARGGVAVLFSSSELPEVLGLSDRVLVMRGGQIRAELDPGEAGAEGVMGHAMWRGAGDGETGGSM